MADDSTDLKQALFQASDGITGAAVLIVVGVAAGNFLDARLHTSPWFVVCLSLLGGALGIFRLVKKAMQIGQGATAGRSGTGGAAGGGTIGETPATTEPTAPVEKADASRLDSPEHQARREKSPDKLKAKSAFDFLDQGDT